MACSCTYFKENCLPVALCSVSTSHDTAFPPSRSIFLVLLSSPLRCLRFLAILSICIWRFTLSPTASSISLLAATPISASRSLWFSRFCLSGGRSPPRSRLTKATACMPAGAPVEGPVGYAAVAFAATPAHTSWSGFRWCRDSAFGAGFISGHKRPG